jgi:hypothetical protein
MPFFAGVLYCCAEPNIHMNGVTVPAAYAVRSSPDYVWGPSGKKGAPIELPTGMHFFQLQPQCADSVPSSRSNALLVSLSR